MAGLDTIPPWLQSPNFIGAMEGGARLGLSARSQDFEESSAADRLKLAYDQMAQNERMQSQAAMQKLQLGQAANMLRAAHEQALQEHYKAMQEAQDKQILNQTAASALRQQQIAQQLQLGTNANKIKQAHEDALVEHYKAMDSRTKATPPGSVEWELQPDGQYKIKSVRGAPDSASALFVQKATEDRKRQKAADALKSYNESFMTKWGFRKPMADTNSLAVPGPMHQDQAAPAPKKGVTHVFNPSTGELDPVDSEDDQGLD